MDDSPTTLAAEDLRRGPAFERVGDAIAMIASEELPLVVTDSAVHRIRVLQQKESRTDASLRLRIIAGGCSGMQYRMDLDDAPRTNDLVEIGRASCREREYETVAGAAESNSIG